MTDEEKKKIQQFEARVRQLILQYKTLQSENEALSETIRQKDGEIANLNREVKQIKSDYNNLKIAKMMEISDGDITEAKQHITRLVREINKCIGLLTSGSDSTEQE